MKAPPEGGSLDFDKAGLERFHLIDLDGDPSTPEPFDASVLPHLRALWWRWRRRGGRPPAQRNIITIRGGRP